MLWYSISILAVVASVQGRAVNISNTWVLPEEGFPVFYRYFRDRISWYEADAVCQFHHANLVTVDTTAQYDAVRAYLKELDITSAVWVGLIRSNSDGDFTWTDYHGLSGDGYWSSAPTSREAPLCAAADPTADYRWEARACGGPSVASFICELPVPQWALGNEGCMVRSLPALTVLYLPESAAVQLTADCGLAGVKRVQCTGNVKREKILKDLSCGGDDEVSSITSMLETATTPVEIDITTTDTDVTEVTTEEKQLVNVKNNNNDGSTTFATVTLSDSSETMPKSTKVSENYVRMNKINKIIVAKHIDIEPSYHNNLQSNVIPVIANLESDINNELSEKLEDEKHMKNKMLHEELARYGNPEIIFTQPTDHFVPPLVMAKAKMSDDMLVLSPEEKHEQQLVEQRIEKDNTKLKQNILDIGLKPSVGITDSRISNYPMIKDIKKGKIKQDVPKKYDEKNDILKLKVSKPYQKPNNTKNEFKYIVTTQATANNRNSYDNEDTIIDLTVIIKEPGEETIFYSNHSSNYQKPNVTPGESNEDRRNITKIQNYKFQNDQKTTQVPSGITFQHEIIEIAIVDTNNNHSNLIEVSTMMPLFKDEIHNNNESKSFEVVESVTTTEGSNISLYSTQENKISSKDILTKTPKNDGFITTKVINTPVTVTHTEGNFTVTQETSLLNNTFNEQFNTTVVTPIIGNLKNRSMHYFELNNGTNQSISMNPNANFTELHDQLGETVNDTDATGDFQSPLLSEASEPLHRPNRSRRPQTPPSRLHKFNPFRILG